MPIRIEIDDLQNPEVLELLQAHFDYAQAASPPKTGHALDGKALQHPDITFWTAWDGTSLLGCAALKELNSRHGEIKSMHTVTAARGKGIASQLLGNLILVARQRSHLRLSLETGTYEAFAPARKLYQRFGFEQCPPFAGYQADQSSMFLRKIL